MQEELPLEERLPAMGNKKRGPCFRVRSAPCRGNTGWGGPLSAGPGSPPARGWPSQGTWGSPGPTQWAPDLTDLTGLEDLPWIGPGLNLDPGALGTRLALAHRSQMASCGLRASVARAARVGEGGGVGARGWHGGLLDGTSPSPSSPGALASLERVRQVASEEGPVEQRLRKRLMALAEAPGQPEARGQWYLTLQPRGTEKGGKFCTVLTHS